MMMDEFDDFNKFEAASLNLESWAEALSWAIGHQALGAMGNLLRPKQYDDEITRRAGRFVLGVDQMTYVVEAIIDAKDFFLKTEDTIREWEDRIIACDPGGSANVSASWSSRIDDFSPTAHSWASKFILNTLRYCDAVFSDLLKIERDPDGYPNIPDIRKWNPEDHVRFGDWLIDEDRYLLPRSKRAELITRLVRERAYVKREYGDSTNGNGTSRDEERYRFAQPLRDRPDPLKYKTIAELWEKKSGEKVDEATMRQSCFRVRAANRKRQNRRM